MIATQNLHTHFTVKPVKNGHLKIEKNNKDLNDKW